ncbi:MAG TPA: methionyl-tRNA formyltransferase, partial [Hanamia sp.]|nr:methionyl-tRNA formyltransferase [Hanamia sp.]
MESPRIVFMGTPEFAVASLDKLFEAGYNIVGVVTAPDKPAGRGMKLSESAVKKYAAEKGLKILQPVKLKAPAFLDELRSLKADVQVVVAFRMLPEVVWNMPPMGTINLHASLLPQYRGAAPINWAIINGEKETGVTTFKLQQEIDTGNILLQEKIPIAHDETAGSLHDKLMVTGADLL